MQPQRQFGTLDFITGIIYIMCAVAILIGFFGMPLLNIGSELTRNNQNAREFTTMSASKIASEATNSRVVEALYDSLSDARALSTLIPFYALYGFIAFAALYGLGAIASILRAVFRGRQRIGFFSGIFRILITPIIYILVPLGILGGFYAFALGTYNLADVMARPSLLKLDVIRNTVNLIPPGTGMILMLGGCVFGALMTLLTTLIGMFRATPTQVVMVQSPYGIPQYGGPQYQPQYGQPQYPPQYGQQPTMGAYGQPQQPQYPPQYPPNQTPPYQQPPVQNPYGGNVPPQNPYGAPPPQYPPNQPPQNPIDWGKKRDDDDF
jgi:hypothetical protein